MPITARRHAVTCSPACRKRRSRARVPSELASRDRWVCRAGKRPVTPFGAPASSTDPATWSTYSTAAAVGPVGFVLNGDGIVCVDLDHCVRDGRVASWAQELLDACPETYVELSPSGTGLHIWGYGNVSHGRRIRDGRMSVEVYGTGRYIALGTRWSGHHLADISTVVERCLSTSVT